jgi:acyl-CoA synthetase (AMP-forming)/AMP-acid ligase II
MTETCSQICTLPPDEVNTHVGTVGRPIPGAAVSVRDGSGAPRPNGEAGRIWVKGAMVADPDWMETGDVGVLDQGGYLTVIGRADEIIVTGGEKVAPAEIEELLVMRDDVAEAAVVGVADPEWGERVVAAVVLAVVPGREGTPDAEALRSYLRENLAPFKVPRSITVVDELPLIGPGKVDRNMLRELTSVAQQEARDL